MSTTTDASRNFQFSPMSSILQDNHIAPIRGSFGSAPNENAPSLEPISNMLQENPDIGNLNWTTWDKTVLRFNDPNTLPAEWSDDLPDFDFTNMAGLQPEGLFTSFDDASMPTDWSNGTF